MMSSDLFYFIYQMFNAAILLVSLALELRIDIPVIAILLGMFLSCPKKLNLFSLYKKALDCTIYWQSLYQNSGSDPSSADPAFPGCS